MDKRKIIAAYRIGFISMQECAQLLGVDSLPILGLMDNAHTDEPRALHKQPINSQG